MTGTFQPRNTSRARELRNQATPAERLLWRALSNRKVGGHKFSRQMPVGPYFADFLCRSVGLVVEIDGWSHNFRAEHDRRRDDFMASQGLTVMRFSNDDVLHNLDGVVQTIGFALDGQAHPQPLPQAGGEQEALPVPLPLAGGVRGGPVDQPPPHPDRHPHA